MSSVLIGIGVALVMLGRLCPYRLALPCTASPRIRASGIQPHGSSSKAAQVRRE